MSVEFERDDREISQIKGRLVSWTRCRNAWEFRATCNRARHRKEGIENLQVSKADIATPA